MIREDIQSYNANLEPSDTAVCDTLATLIDAGLPGSEHKLWHAHPVWFLEGNPIVGYSKQRDGVRLMFWSGMDFGEPQLKPGTGKYKDASIFYTSKDQISSVNIRRWLQKSAHIQWDYKNIVKHKGKLVRLK